MEKNENFVEGIPTILQFVGEDSVRLLGQQIIPQWTETGTIYINMSFYDPDNNVIYFRQLQEE